MSSVYSFLEMVYDHIASRTTRYLYSGHDKQIVNTNIRGLDNKKKDGNAHQGSTSL